MLKFVMLTMLMAPLCILGSCQEEIPPTVDVNSDDSITPQSELSQLIVKVTMLDGSQDNIIDKSSCTTIIFPIEGIYQDKETNFNSLNEVLELGVEALDIEWIYPIRVVLADHYEIELMNADELVDIQDLCLEGGDDPDIECIDFVYPITLSVFNSQTEEASVAIVESDKSAYRVFADNKQFVSIQYPISLVDAESTSYEVESNDQLLATIFSRQGSCDEQDIIEFDEPLLSNLGEILVSGNWKIAQFLDVDDKTALYEGYSVRFNSDLTLIAFGNEGQFEGEWELDIFDAVDTLELDFDTDNPSFILLNDDWEIVSYDHNTINMEAEGDDDLTTKSARLERL